MAQSKRTAASYLAEQRNTTAKNRFMGKSLAEMKKMYSAMTSEERGKNVETFRRAAAAAKKAAAKKPAAKTQSAPPKRRTQPTPPPTKSKASDKAVEGGYTISPKNRKPGTRGAAQQPKAKTEPETRRSPGGRAQVKRGGLAKLRTSLGKLSDAFKLTRKAGEVFTVGNMRYVSDGKGGIRSSQRIR